LPQEFSLQDVQFGAIVTEVRPIRLLPVPVVPVFHDTKLLRLCLIIMPDCELYSQRLLLTKRTGKSTPSESMQPGQRREQEGSESGASRSAAKIADEVLILEMSANSLPS
jgi:hypothetical protein